MKASLEDKFPNATISLIEGKGGVFEVKKGGQLLFSKKQLGRFPEHREIIDKLT